MPASRPRTRRAVLLDIDHRVATVTLSRPDTRNAMDPDLLDELVEAIARCADRDGLRGVVVTGAGRDFSAGGDIETLRRGLLDPTLERCHVGYLSATLHRAIVAIDELPVPVVAAVDGRAGGAGFALALACDARVATERAVFDFAYPRLGLTPDGGMTWSLPRVVGAARALELLIEVPIIRAPQALETGIVREIVAHDDLMPCSRRVVERIAKQPPAYVAAVKRLARGSPSAGLEAHLELERQALMLAAETDEARRRILAAADRGDAR